jgi:hypothetical protein
MRSLATNIGKEGFFLTCLFISLCDIISMKPYQSNWGTLFLHPMPILPFWRYLARQQLPHHEGVAKIPKSSHNHEKWHAKFMRFVIGSVPDNWWKTR